MTSFNAVSLYSPLSTLIIGIITCVGLLGFGSFVLRAIHMELPSPWNLTIGILLGIQTLSLVVQAVGMAGLASKPVLVGIWMLTSFAGIVYVFYNKFRFAPNTLNPLRSWDLIPLTITLVSLAVVLLIALAPTNRNDELHYHLLTPSRIVADQGLVFYRLPWEGAIYPQMVFQIAAAPLHALGFPDATNVVNWAIGLSLLWFSWYLLNEGRRESSWVHLWLSVLIVGIWPAVYYTNSSAHAMGNLAGALLIVALFRKDALLNTVSLRAYVVLISFLAMCLVSTKVSYFPLSACVVTGLLLLLIKDSPVRELYYGTLLIFAPWAMFYLPIVFWTFAQSGSPFGPLFLGFFKDFTIYDASLSQLLSEEFARIKEQHSIVEAFDQAKKLAVWYSPLMWIAIIGMLFSNSVKRSVRIFSFSILVVTALTLLLLTAFELRYVSSIFYAFVICFALFASQKVRDLLVKPSKKLLPISAIAILPWLIVQGYYGSQYFATSLGLSSKTDFFHKYISFYEDYRALHGLLPEDASLLVQLDGTPYVLNARDLRMPSTYSPRPIYFHPDDIQRGTDVYLFHISEPGQLADAAAPDGFKFGKLIYQNFSAYYADNIRLPGEDSTRKSIRVYRLLRQESESSKQSTDRSPILRSWRPKESTQLRTRTTTRC